MAKYIFLNRFFFPDHSATSQMLSDLAFDLARSGMDVHIITSRLRYDDAAAQLPARESMDGVEVHRIWTSRFGRANLLGRAFDYLSFYLSAFTKLFGLARRGDVIVAKTDPPLISVVAGWVAALRGARLVNWLQDLFPEVAAALGIGKGESAPIRLLRWLRNRSLLRAQTNVVIGERMADRLRQQGVPDERIRVIHNWTDGAKVYPVEDNPLRTAWGLDDKFVVGYSGNMGRAHEFETIMSAAEGLKARDDIRFLFIGGGPQKELIERTARERHLPNIEFQPYQARDRLAESLSVADVHLISLQPQLESLIVPSKFYGIAAAGRAALFIGDKDGEIPRLLAQADMGRALEPGDAEGLAREIQVMADDRQTTRDMGDRARKLLESRFDQKLGVAGFREVLVRAAG